MGPACTALVQDLSEETGYSSGLPTTTGGFSAAVTPAAAYCVPQDLAARMAWLPLAKTTQEQEAWEYMRVCHRCCMRRGRGCTAVIVVYAFHVVSMSHSHMVPQCHNPTASQCYTVSTDPTALQSQGRMVPQPHSPPVLQPHTVPQLHGLHSPTVSPPDTVPQSHVPQTLAQALANEVLKGHIPGTQNPTIRDTGSWVSVTHREDVFG